MTSQGVGKVLKQIADLQFVSNLGDFSHIADDAVGMSRARVSEILSEIADLQIPTNLGDFSSASGLKPRVSEILSEIANLQIPINLGDFSNIADAAAREEGRAAGVRAAGWAGTANHNGMGKCCRSAKKPTGYPAPF